MRASAASNDSGTGSVASPAAMVAKTEAEHRSWTDRALQASAATARSARSKRDQSPAGSDGNRSCAT